MKKEKIRWYSKGKLEPSEDTFEEENDEKSDLFFIGTTGYKMAWGYYHNESRIYIMEEKNGDSVTLYNNWLWRDARGYTILSDDEIKDHIHSNQTPIQIFNDKTFTPVYFKDLPDEIKDRIK